MDRTRTLTALFALGRLAFGAGLMASPARLASGWLGSDAERPPVKIAVRAVGARDVAHSAGSLVVLGDRDAPLPWIAGTLLPDLCDVTDTIATPGVDHPRNERWGTVALGGGSALAGLALLRAARR